MKKLLEKLITKSIQLFLVVVQVVTLLGICSIGSKVIVAATQPVINGDNILGEFLRGTPYTTADNTNKYADLINYSIIPTTSNTTNQSAIIKTLKEPKDTETVYSPATIEVVEEPESIEIAQVKVEKEFDEYIVKRGDTLSSISKQFYNDYNKYTIIAEYNNIKNANRISINQTIKIPNLDILNSSKEESNNNVSVEETTVNIDNQNTNSTQYVPNDNDIEVLVKAAMANNGGNYDTIKNIISYADTITKTKYTNVPIELVLSVIDIESGFDPSAKNSNGTCYGLMQIHKCNFGWISDSIGKSSEYKSKGSSMFLEYETSIEAGCIILSNLINKYGNNYHSVLMAYNGGEGYLKKMNRKGYYSSSYSREVYSYMANRY